WGSLGTTQKSSLVTGGTIRLATGVTPVWKADGSLDFNSVSEQRRHLEVELEMAMGANLLTEYDAYVARSTRALRIQFDGPEIEPSFNRYLRIDLTGQYATEPEMFGEVEGENLVRLTLASHEDPNGNEFSIEVQNNIASA
ncbi:MAG: hypothetical protein ACRDIB_18260, partial [Ardenticatenaceae bacterium]